jgi:hypothetical protein
MSDISLKQAIQALSARDPASVAALTKLAIERLRQLDCGHSPTNDDAEPPNALPRAAAAYALTSSLPPAESQLPLHWPWPRSDWSPRDKRDNETRAGALLIASLARDLRQPVDHARPTETKQR